MNIDFSQVAGSPDNEKLNFLINAVKICQDRINTLENNHLILLNESSKVEKKVDDLAENINDQFNKIEQEQTKHTKVLEFLNVGQKELKADIKAAKDDLVIRIDYFDAKMDNLKNLLLKFIDGKNP